MIKAPRKPRALRPGVEEVRGRGGERSHGDRGGNAERMRARDQTNTMLTPLFEDSAPRGINGRLDWTIEGLSLHRDVIGGHSCVMAESPPGHEDGSRPLCDDSSGSFGFQVALELRAEASGDKLMADPGSDQDLSS